MDIQRFWVNFFSKLKAEPIINRGATKNSIVTKSDALPSVKIDPSAIIATHVGVALEDPIPT